MDSVTHIVLGACIGEVVAGKQLGRKALILGAAAQSLPDIDAVASLWLSPAQDLLAHRGFTHSFLFVLLASGVLSGIGSKYLNRDNFPVWRWFYFFSLQLFIHVFLDAFNAYGTGWFEPFSNSRISFNMLFVADPFAIIPIVIGFAFLILVPYHNPRRQMVAWSSIICFAVYLGYCGLNKLLIDSNVRENLKSQGIEANPYVSTPTPLNSWLWYIVVNTPQGSLVGYRSVFDSQEKIDFEFFDRADSLLNRLPELSRLPNLEDAQRLHKFSQGFYTIEQWGDTLVFNDLRFGQMIGWKDRRARFVFHYYLNRPDNEMVVQRGRFAGWDGEAVQSLLNRIRGN